jgi:hypothetical protein
MPLLGLFLLIPISRRAGGNKGASENGAGLGLVGRAILQRNRVGSKHERAVAVQVWMKECLQKRSNLGVSL